MEDDSGTERPVFIANERVYELTCPECGDVATSKHSLGGTPRFFCDCGNSWTRNDIDNCLECGKPLGGTDVLCHTCQENGGGPK